MALGVLPAGPEGDSVRHEDGFRERAGESSQLPRGLVEDVLTAGMAAPSLHNTQPWRFCVRDADATIELRIDATRLLPAADPHGRAAHIGCGAALLNLRIAAAALGLQGRARLMPDPAQPLLLARIQLTRSHETSAWERELYGAIPRRRTNRQPFSNRPVPAGIRAELTEAAAADGGIFHYCSDDEAIRLRDLAAEAERDLLADPAYRAELTRWVGGDRDQDGIPASALGPRSPEGREPVRAFSRIREGEAARYAWFEEHPQLAVLSVRLGGPREWLAAGQALERMWLTATCRGVSVCPLTQPLETASGWLVRDPQSGAEQPQMILRIGYGLPVPAQATRRALADVTDWIAGGDDDTQAAPGC
jgi:nitroreductase